MPGPASANNPKSWIFKNSKKLYEEFLSQTNQEQHFTSLIANLFRLELLPLRLWKGVNKRISFHKGKNWVNIFTNAYKQARGDDFLALLYDIDHTRH